jgi:8-oxo-dGTP pyrophosphatase MutT (NUDIX family)
MSDLFNLALERIGSAQERSSDFDLNTDIVLPESRKLRPAGVLILLQQFDGAWRVYLTKRSSALKHHPGQIAFPGGKMDADDPDIAATAQREAWEEIGLPLGHSKVIGTLPDHETVTGFSVTPVVATVETGFEIVRQPSEVDEVFTVPLAHVLDPANFVVESRRWKGHRRHYYAVPFGPYYIWGATARMLRSWADAVAS